MSSLIEELHGSIDQERWPNDDGHKVNESYNRTSLNDHSNHHQSCKGNNNEQQQRVNLYTSSWLKAIESDPHPHPFQQQQHRHYHIVLPVLLLWSLFPSYLSTKKIARHLSCEPIVSCYLMPKYISIYALLLLLLLFNASSILCFDSFDNLGQTRTSLCEKTGINALGMESGIIPDSALSASSSYNEQSVGPQNARLNRELNGGAWCPANQIDNTNSGHEWIQINLTEPFVITKIATQGRFGNGMGVEYAETFWLEYTRDGLKWTKWRNQYGQTDIVGNVDTYSIVENILSIPMVGVTAIRLIPVSSFTRTCCLRFEIYGCPYKDGLISYSMMDGQYNGPFGKLIDETYDGIRSESGFLSGGLGQLVDGIKGDDDYKVNKGFEWIAWKANTESQLSITFHFADIRNFSLATFHCHNMFMKDIQVFYSAKIWFSLDGRQWAPVPEDFGYMPDIALERARDVVIHLHHRIGRFIKFDFRFAAKWLLISEATFKSSPVNRGLSINELDFVDIGPITTTPIETTRTIYNEPIIFLIFAAVICFLLILFGVLLFWLARKRKEKITGTEYTTVPMKDVSPTPLYCEPQDFNGLPSPFLSNGDPEYAVPDLLDNGRTTFLNNNIVKPMNGNLMNPISLTQSPNSYVKRSDNWTLNNNITNNTNNNSNINNINNGDHYDDGKARYYASTDVLLRNNEQSINGFGPGFFLTNRNLNTMLPIVPLPTVHQTYKHESPPSSLSSNASKVLKLNSSTHSTSLESYENTAMHSLSVKSSSPIATNNIIPLLKDKEVSIIDSHFGYSKFGDCELGFLTRKNEKKLVILKTLNGNKKFQEEFMQEINEMWRISNKCNDTFARIYGYISKYDYLAMVMEYEDMNLKKFLLNCSPNDFGIPELIEIATQVAEAMQELHFHGFIHRDLAARNCLIFTKNNRVKITISGALINDFKDEYFKEIYPIRWMSYESILKQIFSNKSDVFSFGVTLWEIMKYCQSLPHQPLSNEELLNEVYNEENSIKSCDSSSAFYNHPFSDSNHSNDSKNILRLPKPKDCPEEIYDLIIECTQRCENSRPQFHEIVYFLKSKNRQI